MPSCRTANLAHGWARRTLLSHLAPRSHFGPYALLLTKRGREPTDEPPDLWMWTNIVLLAGGPRNGSSPAASVRRLGCLVAPLPRPCAPCPPACPRRAAAPSRCPSGCCAALSTRSPRASCGTDAVGRPAQLTAVTSSMPHTASVHHQSTNTLRRVGPCTIPVASRVARSTHERPTYATRTTGCTRRAGERRARMNRMWTWRAARWWKARARAARGTLLIRVKVHPVCEI